MKEFNSFPTRFVPQKGMRLTMNKKTIEDVDVKGKKVLVRCDFNVPLKDGKITDDTRITAALPTIKYLMEHGAKVILCSHLGRPKGEVKEEFSLRPVAEELTELLDTDVKFATDTTGDSAKKVTGSLTDGEVALLENVRFDPREEQNDDTLAMELADLSDGIYVNDAFGAAHRAHSSTEGVAHHVDEAVEGFLMEKEVRFLNGTLDNPEKPFIAILGGAKVSDKIGVIENLLDKVDEILIGGGMAYTFLKAKGYEIGDSLCEEDKIEEAKKIMKKAEEAGVKIVLPKDTAIAPVQEETDDTLDKKAKQKAFFSFLETSHDKIVDSDKIPAGWQGCDIGPRTCKEFEDELQGAKTILWNGPLGICEVEKFSIGTERTAEAIAKTNAISIVGGGDSVAAIKKLGLENEFTHISTGGGASLELLEGKELPGIACLTDKEVKTKKDETRTVKDNSVEKTI